MDSKKIEGQVTLTQMLKALDKKVAGGVEKKLKKLSKKKVFQAPLDRNKADQIGRKIAYSDVTKEVSRWEPIVDEHRQARQIRFPLDLQPNVLPTIAESVGELKPMNEFEQAIQDVVSTSETALHDNKLHSKAEEKYLKAISVEEAQERHRELQRMRVLLSSYAAKMRRQKGIKSKSYRRLLKHERIRNHMKRVESNQDLLLEEIEKLKRLRARERASLKHKNTGKWAMHAKFRSKYDESARAAMLAQIGIAEKLLEKPTEPDTDSESDSESDSDIPTSDTSEDEQEEEELEAPEADDEVDAMDHVEEDAEASRPIISTDAVDDADEEEDDLQRKLMSEAFAGDDVVAEFKRTKDQITGEEQPKDKDLYLPGWGAWAGPGIKENTKKRERYIVKARKLPRRDDNLGNVIISEKANEKIKEKMVKRLPRGIKKGEQLTKMLTQPTAATFTSQVSHREAVKPRIKTKMGTRIEPMSENMLKFNRKAAKFN